MFQLLVFYQLLSQVKPILHEIFDLYCIVHQSITDNLKITNTYKVGKKTENPYISQLYPDSEYTCFHHKTTADEGTSILRVSASIGLSFSLLSDAVRLIDRDRLAVHQTQTNLTVQIALKQPVSYKN